jgi:quinol monooxygenase YgiN
MISFTVRLTFEDIQQDAVAAILRPLTAASRQESGCVSYIAHFVENEPCTVLIYEQYVDEAALEHHRNAPHFSQYAQNGLYLLPHTRALEMLTAIA